MDQSLTDRVWYKIELKELPMTNGKPNKLMHYQNKAKELYDQKVINFESSKTVSAADKEFVSTILKSGTVSDKVSALTILIQESPMFHFKQLNDSLFQGMALKKSRREALMAVDSIKDLLLGSLLPDRKLKYFSDQPFSATKCTSMHLVIWYFEDLLKKFYYKFIQLLEQLALDPLMFVKSKALTYIYELLKTKPEGEQNLLTLLVNKLGDQEKKVASKASHLLSLLLQEHPAMKLIIIKEVERLIFRVNASERAKYYAIDFINQIVLSNSPQDKSCANYLINIYFSVFEGLVSNSSQKDLDAELKDGINVKIMAGLLTGVNRAFPYTETDQTIFEKHIETLFRICHMGTFNTSVQALTLIFQVQTHHQTLSDRFYRVLYDLLMDKRLGFSSKQSLFLNLLYKATNQDSNLARTRSFIRRMIQICVTCQVPFTCACLFMIGRMMKEKPGLKTMINFIANDEEEKFEDVPEEDTLETVANSSNKPQNTFDSKYDPRKRDPSFANADSTYLWELMPFVNHFHPTVSLYARSLLKDAQIEMPENASNYDPLINHTLSKFLDRFVYKNPKKMQNEYKGSSLMQPRIQQLQEQPLNLLDWSKKNEMNVPVEEIFFMKYFQANPKKAKDTSKQEDQVWDDLENPSDHSADEGDFGLDDGADIDEDLSFYDDALPDQELADSDDTELESMDEEISAENLEVSDSDASVKNKESPRKKRKTGSLASKAKSLGYKGSFFNDALSEFAPIEDFEAFL